MSYTTTTANPIEWDGKNKICSECPEELTMNDYEDICNTCYNLEENEDQELSPERKELLKRFMQFPTLEKK